MSYVFVDDLSVYLMFYLYFEGMSYVFICDFAVSYLFIDDLADCVMFNL